MVRLRFSWLHYQSDVARPLFRNRYADEWVGFLVLLAIVLFGCAVVEAGFLREWLTPAGRIHFVLPQSGVAGLAVGNDIEVMGVRAGVIRKLELNESGRLYAEGAIEPQFERFIHVDSKATIRHRFVVAGPSYIELTHGQGQALDWGYAVLNAAVEPNPADMIAQTVQDVRARLVPAMDNMQAITEQVKGLLVDLRAGKGTVGALLTREETLERVNTVLASLNEVMHEANGALGDVHVMAHDLKSSTSDVQQTIHHVNESTAQLPALLVEAEAGANSLHHLADQLRTLWLLGGHGGEMKSHRLSGREVRP